MGRGQPGHSDQGPASPARGCDDAAKAAMKIRASAPVGALLILGFGYSGFLSRLEFLDSLRASDSAC
jgi:hypothetical protein